MPATFVHWALVKVALVPITAMVVASAGAEGSRASQLLGSQPGLGDLLRINRAQLGQVPGQAVPFGVEAASTRVDA